MFGIRFLGNTHVPHHKNTAQMKSVPMTPPKEVLLPMSMHIGAPATPIVKFGDEVKVGQKIAEASGYVSSPIYATVSGKVGRLESYLCSNGKKVDAIRITSDGLMTPYEGITPPDIHDLDSFINAVRESGVVGLGGAGFPVAVKLDAIKKGIIDTVVINGSECEPFITSDTRTMLDESEWIKEAVDLIDKYAPTVKNYIIGIEKNKPSCIEEMKRIFADNEKVKVKALQPTYPQGAEKVLIFNTVKRIVPEGKLPADVGVLVMNVTTLSVIAKYAKTGMPLVSRSVTFDGSAVKEPKNVTVPIGTSIEELIEFSGGLKGEAGKVLYGGPMMGNPACNLKEPIMKTTGAITVFTREESIPKEPSACIHCARCVDACPHLLVPYEFSAALLESDKETRMKRLEDSKIMLCMECGCCSYVCPANRELVQNNRIAKTEYRDYVAHQSTLKK